jgi:hypothetical protein
MHITCSLLLYAVGRGNDVSGGAAAPYSWKLKGCRVVTGASLRLFVAHAVVSLSMILVRCAHTLGCCLPCLWWTSAATRCTCTCRKVNAEIVRLLAKHTGNDEEKISQDISRPKYFSAYDAQDYGLIDRVLESEEKDVTEALESISKGKYEWNLADKDEAKEHPSGSSES